MAVYLILIPVAFQADLVLISLAVAETVEAAFGIGGMGFRTVFVVLAFSFVIGTLLGHWFRGRLIDWYYAAAAYWFGLVHFLFIGAFFFFFTINAFYRFHVYLPPAPLAAVAFGIAFLLHLYGTRASGRMEITRRTVSLPGLPSAWRGKRLVYVSDFHLGNIRKEGFAAKVVRKVTALKPEAIFIGGDLYDGPACDTAGIIEPLRALKAPLGVYFVTGNHEYFFRDLARGLAAIRAQGIRILHNEKADVGGLTVVGVDDKTARRREDLKQVLAGIPIDRAKPAVLLMHEPKNLDVARAAGITLGLFGHTHHGQIFPLNFITRRIYRGFDYGLKRLGDMQVMTSSGVGTWGPPLRLGTKSEIVLIDFL